jgi:hypothetical protein
VRTTKISARRPIVARLQPITTHPAKKAVGASRNQRGDKPAESVSAALLTVVQKLEVAMASV